MPTSIQTILQTALPPGPTGDSGISGFSGFSGTSGFSGFSGTSGFSGQSGFSGVNGTNGASGISGWSGASGISGFSGLGYANLTSTTSVAVGTGSKVFTVNQAVGTNSYTVGMRVRVFSTASPTNFMEGLITAYTTTSLTINADLIGGTGTIASWGIDVAGQSGISGFSGISGTNGTNGSNGASGISGFSGISGWSGISGFSGFTGPTVYPAAGIAVSTGSSWTTSKTSPSGTIVGDTDTQTLTNKTLSGQNNTINSNESLTLAVSDETTNITTGNAKITFRAPFALTLYQIPRASLSTASSSGTPTVDIDVNGVSIFSTQLSIDANEKTSTTAVTAAVLSTTSIADDAEITVDITNAGTGAKGLKVTLYYRRT